MTNVFTRIFDSIESDIHSLLDKKEGKNPIQALNHYLRQSEKETEKVKSLIERQHQLKEEFTVERKEADNMADKRKQQAEIAEKAGETELAAFALKEFEEYAARAERLTLNEIEAMKQLESLEKRYEEMRYKLKEMRLKRMELMGKENVARARYEMDKLTGSSFNKSSLKFSEMERYIEDLEFKVTNDYNHHTLDSKIARLEKEMADNENEDEQNEKVI
ncbi:PspA/IM30 family protein [Salipaludibacillus sp. LMS25]|uniref:PspA/IM30 family protein n=1 Tax=Salipaludibacillus sp. LMS25 TaxID=2924031 RepID=UPI0020D0976D|nr:PspA/IM30 family protein [Salipaludibacillus sp. LMS25]UTR15479.1 PspA/IM30 family protein [Salipaludibacillus sp. LMS25]